MALCQTEKDAISCHVMGDDWYQSHTTVADANGEVTLPVRNQGLNVIKAEHETASTDPGKTNMTNHFATLSFILEHAPE